MKAKKREFRGSENYGTLRKTSVQTRKMDLPSFVLPAYGTTPVVFTWSSVAALGATVGAEDPEERILRPQLQPPKPSLHRELQCKAQRNKNSTNC